MQRFITLLKTLGPGIIFASLCIGETHIALLTYAGAKYGFALLWMVVMVHLFYYPTFEYGARYAAATGKTLIDGYSENRPGRFLLWVFLFFMWISPIIILASIGGLTASVLYAALPSISFNTWCVIGWVVSLGVVLGGKYKALESISKLLVLIIVVMAIFAFSVSPPEAAPFVKGLVPQIPAVAGVMLVVIAILRVPTDPASSIFLSEWAQVKRSQWLEGPDDTSDKNALLVSLKKAIFDIRVGFVLSCLVGMIYLSLGATVIRPLGIIPEGVDISLKLSEIFTQSVGRWIFPLFILATFAAFWGGYLSVMDGATRLLKNILRALFNAPENVTKWVGPIYLIVVSTGGLAIATKYQRPMWMVLFAVSVGLIYYPLVIGQNIYLVNRRIAPEFRPGKLNLVFACLGFVLAVTGFILLIMGRLLKMFQ